MKCINCGKDIPNELTYCPNCNHNNNEITFNILRKKLNQDILIYLAIASFIISFIFPKANILTLAAALTVIIRKPNNLYLKIAAWSLILVSIGSLFFDKLIVILEKVLYFLR